VSVVELRRGGSGAASKSGPVFLVHALGGMVLVYRELAMRLEAGRSCFGIEAQGIDGREPPLDCVEALAATHIDEIRRHGAPSAWLLSGWSFGGVVAFEMSVQLAREGERVCAAMLDSRGLMDRMAGSREVSRPRAEPVTWDKGAALDLLAKTEAAHLVALARYRPGRTAAPLLVVRAAIEQSGADEDDTLGFGALAEGPLETLTFPASHEALLVPPHVDHVARALDGFFASWDRT
jgi:thioesterase domain-containing protein